MWKIRAEATRTADTKIVVHILGNKVGISKRQRNRISIIILQPFRIALFRHVKLQIRCASKDKARMRLLNLGHQVLKRSSRININGEPIAVTMTDIHITKTPNRRALPLDFA